MNDDRHPPLPRLFHVYMGILVILGAFAMGQNARAVRSGESFQGGIEAFYPIRIFY